MSGSSGTDNNKLLKKRIEVVAVVLIALATISSAWCVYEAARWSGHQAFELSSASALRAESVRTTTIANTHAIYDTNLFLAWLDASSSNQTIKAEYIKSRFSKDFQPAFNAWVASAGPDNPIPPGTPLDLPEYQLTESQNIIKYVNDSEAAVLRARDYNQNSDNYVLNTVFFALVLFLAGISTRWESLTVQKALLALATAIYLVAFGILLTQPVSFAFIL